MLLLGLSNKARSGKDSLGAHLASTHGFHVLHFSDALKEEATQAGWSPDNKNESARAVIGRIYAKIPVNGDVSKLNDIEREIVRHLNTQHIAITDIPADVSYLQWHGTGFRRAQDADYWVKETYKRIVDHWAQTRKSEYLDEVTYHSKIPVRPIADEQMILFDERFRVAICDTRFINELLAVKKWGGWSINVRRLVPRRVVDADSWNKDVIQVWDYYVDPERDPFHPSEIELDAIPHDFHIEARSLDELYYKGDNIVKYLTQGGAKWLTR